MPEFHPVDHDPFAQPQPMLMPVDHDPFGGQHPGVTMDSDLSSMDPYEAIKLRSELATRGGYTPEQAAQNQAETGMGLLYATPIGNALSARDAMESKWQAQELERQGDTEGARRAFAQAAASAGSAFLPGMGRVGMGHAASEAARESADRLAAIFAYHGSPHKFDKFDMSKLGTGEGAQSYGHGLYFAENPQVAKDYQRSLAGKGMPLKDIVEGHLGPDLPVTQGDLGQIYSAAVHGDKDALQAAKAVQARLPHLRDEGVSFMGPPGERGQKLAAAIESVRDANRGHLYHTELDVDHHQLLDWDKRFEQQSPTVQEALRRLPHARAMLQQEQVVNDLRAQLEQLKSQPLTREIGEKGGELQRRLLQEARKYEDLDNQFHDYRSWTSSPESVATLRDAGIPGIRYLDRGSRDAEDGTRNIVMFDDSPIKILGRE